MNAETRRTIKLALDARRRQLLADEATPRADRRAGIVRHGTEAAYRWDRCRCERCRETRRLSRNRQEATG